jgi:ADP-ribose pyrophosphatase YjhB (NUDIX family)
MKSDRGFFRNGSTSYLGDHSYDAAMKFCPRCGLELLSRMDGGRMRPTCPGEGCGFVHYGDYSIGAGAVVLQEDRVLLIERRTGDRVWWQIPGGYVEADEAIGDAVEREVLEETGVSAQLIDVVGFRHAAAMRIDRPVANIYVVFRLDAIAGDPRPDGVESYRAAFFARDELDGVTGLSGESRWAVETAFDHREHRGLLPRTWGDEPPRPGRSLFGLFLP